MVWKARNGIVFRNKILCIQSLIFDTSLWLEIKVFFADGHSTFAHFLD